jgi:hypothetical protein|tara:strand:+ start:1440 stop:1631 length:192 start_codon:yes stop_codon:yes gene_type:complete
MTFFIGTLTFDIGIWNFLKRVGNKISKGVVAYGTARAASEMTRQGYHYESEALLRSLKDHRKI